MRVSQLFPLRSALALLIAGCGFAASLHGQTVTNLAFFQGFNGDWPLGSLVQATDGNFYGTTLYGGVSGLDGPGNVFRITPDGKISNVYIFCSQANCADGLYPTSGPVLGADGNLYGVTSNGGAGGFYGDGTFYKLTLGGKLKTLYTFCTTTCSDGAYPNGIILGSNGNFYGTTQRGGDLNAGTIFEISSQGEFKLLYTFCSMVSCTDEFYSEFPPIQAANGNLYGTDAYNMYELTPAGDYQVLYSFAADANPVTQDANGNFFGTTQQSDGGAVAFEFTATNQYSLLDTFPYPTEAVAGLTLANDGNFYGMTLNGGPRGGTIFQLTPNGVLNTIYNFCTPFCSPEASPYGSLFQSTDGALYGTSACDLCYGNVFKLSNNLSPLVETVPTMGRAGTKVLILGNNLTGSTSVTFNGKQAAFTVNSATYITATVPKGATTGTVQVVTPTGTLSSNPQFVVTE